MIYTIYAKSSEVLIAMLIRTLNRYYGMEFKQSYDKKTRIHTLEMRTEEDKLVGNSDRLEENKE